MGNIIPFGLLFFPLPAVQVVLIFRAVLILIELDVLFLVWSFRIFHTLFLKVHKISYQPRICGLFLQILLRNSELKVDNR